MRFTAAARRHATGSLDPHWWHGVDNMRRAARVVAQALAEKDPAGKDIYHGQCHSLRPAARTA